MQFFFLHLFPLYLDTISNFFWLIWSLRGSGYFCFNTSLRKALRHIISLTIPILISKCINNWTRKSSEIWSHFKYRKKVFSCNIVAWKNFWMYNQISILDSFSGIIFKWIFFRKRHRVIFRKIKYILYPIRWEQFTKYFLFKYFFVYYSYYFLCKKIWKK